MTNLPKHDHKYFSLARLFCKIPIHDISFLEEDSFSLESIKCTNKRF